MAETNAEAGAPRPPLRPGPPSLRPPAQAGLRRLPDRIGLHLSLLALTVVTTTFAGYVLAQRPGLTEGGALMQGLGFSATLLAILLAHEMGHYVFARLHHVDTTLPFVIPVPPVLPVLGLISFGTAGAVIRMRSPIATRAALIDIGASGPIVGAVVALPLLALGLSWSHVVESPAALQSFWFGHRTLVSVVEGFLHRLASHAPAAAAVAPGLSLGDNLIMRGLTRLMFGPLLPGQDVLVHPVALAAWFGLLVTCLNLFPLGQLDGGHIAYAVLGERGHGLLGRVVSYLLLGLACVSSLSWLLWWAATRFVIGFAHPPVQRDREPLGGLRAAVVALSLALFLATFIPVPLDSW